MIMISLHQIARAVLVLVVGALTLLAFEAPELLNAGDLAVTVGARVAALYVLTAVVYLAFPTRRRVDLTCFVIFASWAFELRGAAGPYDLLAAKLVGDTLGAAAMQIPSYVERLRALDRSGGYLIERRRWAPVVRPLSAFLALPAPAKAPFGADDRRQK